MRRGEVWWVDFDPAVGSEICKTRPAVIISNDTANKFVARVVVVPFTSNVSRLYPGEAIITINGTPNKLTADQIMTADKKRLKKYVDVLTSDDMEKVEDTVRMHLGL